MLERAATLADTDLMTAADLSLPETTPPAPATIEDGQLMESLADQERNAIMAALEASRWNKTAAAKKLGMTLRQLRYRLQKFGIS